MQERFTTSRLMARRPRPSDADEIARWANDWDIVRMTSRMPFPYTLDDARAWIGYTEQAWAAGLDYAFALTERGDPHERFIGSVGVVTGALHDGALRRDIDQFEVGYWIAKPFWGRGYATEALAGLLAWGARCLEAKPIVAGHYADNAASGRTLIKNGFTPTGETQIAVSRARKTPAPTLRYVRAQGWASAPESAS